MVFLGVLIAAAVMIVVLCLILFTHGPSD